jgi:hypothetical protein
MQVVERLPHRLPNMGGASQCVDQKKRGASSREPKLCSPTLVRRAKESWGADKEREANAPLTGSAHADAEVERWKRAFCAYTHELTTVNLYNRLLAYTDELFEVVLAHMDHLKEPRHEAYIRADRVDSTGEVEKVLSGKDSIFVVQVAPGVFVEKQPARRGPRATPGSA